MAKHRIRPKTKDRYKQTMRNVIKGLSRKVIIYKQPIKSECPNCYFDKFTNRSSGKCKWTNVNLGNDDSVEEQQARLGPDAPIRYLYFKFGRCPVCRGLGYLETQRRTWADCLVTWNPPERRGGNEMIYTPAGTEGSTVVRLKTDPKYYDTFKNCTKIVVEGIECKISRPPVMRGLGNQTLLIVIAFTTDKPKIDSGEIIKDYS